MAEGNLEITCPDCKSLLVIDRVTGEILFHKPPETAGKQSFDSLVNQLQTSKSESAKKFQKELESQKDRSRLLEEKFKEAMQRADKSGKPMPNPLDME